MAIRDHEDNKLTPREAAKRVVERELESCYYWHEHGSNGFYMDGLTPREVRIISEQVDKIVIAIKKQLRRK